jgi:hypothetical protein
MDTRTVYSVRNKIWIDLYKVFGKLEAFSCVPRARIEKLKFFS